MRVALAALIVSLFTFVAAAGDDDKHRHEHFRGREFLFSFGAGGLFGDTLEEGDSPVFDGGIEIDDAPYLEARFGMRPLWWVEVEGAVSYAASAFEADTGTSGLFGGEGRRELADLDIWHYSVNANFHFSSHGMFDPFVAIGAGAATYNVDVSDVDADTKFALVFGGGAYVWVADVFGLRFDVKDLITVIDVENDYDYSCGCYYDYDTSENTIHNLVATGGIAFRFR